MSDYRMETPDKAILQFEERPSGQPEALKSWFYPGYNSGVWSLCTRRRRISKNHSFGYQLLMEEVPGAIHFQTPFPGDATGEPSRSKSFRLRTAP